MIRLTMYSVHKWIAVSVGIFFLAWLISGIVMVLPLGPDNFSSETAELGFVEFKVSPADAVAVIRKIGGESLRIKRMQLRRIQNFIVYDITVEDGDFYLIDAKSGRVFAVSPEMAVRAVRQTFRINGSNPKIDRIDRHDLSYPWGALPAYRISLGDDSGTVYHVSMRDGTVQRSNAWQRLKVAIGSLHTFEPVRVLTKRTAFRKGLLVLVSVIGIAAALTGYYLAFRRP